MTPHKEPIEVDLGQDEDQECLIVKTPHATYFYQSEAGGFSSILDRDGVDWIGFRRGSQEVPYGAATMFRGLPNLVHPDNIGHPGYDYCTSRVLSSEPPIRIETSAKSDLWRWRWDFHDDYALLDIDTTPADQPYWFLYEGTVAGSFRPFTSFWGTDASPKRCETPELITRRDEVIYEPFRWAYFGANDYPRVFFVARLEPGRETNMFSYMAGDNAGLDAADGMVVFGFGRGPGTSKHLTGPNRFLIGFVESVQHEAIAAKVESYLAQVRDGEP